MDLAKLRAFIVVAEELNFRRSADILGMSQPPLSRLISSLEKELEVQLFERTTRSVHLTGAGVILLKESREIMAALERIESDVRSAAKSRRGSLKVAFSSTAFLARFPVIIEDFKTRFPRLQLELQQSSAKEILKGVASSKFDVGFVEELTSFPSLKSHCVSEEALGVLVPKNHILAKRSSIAFHELSKETIILHNKNEANYFHKRISKIIQDMPKGPKVYVKGENESCPILVATGKGVSLTIKGTETPWVRDVAFVPIREMFMPVSAFWRESEDNDALRAFVSVVIESQSLRPSETRCLELRRIPE